MHFSLHKFPGSCKLPTSALFILTCPFSGPQSTIQCQGAARCTAEGYSCSAQSCALSAVSTAQHQGSTQGPSECKGLHLLWQMAQCLPGSHSSSARCFQALANREGAEQDTDMPTDWSQLAAVGRGPSCQKGWLIREHRESRRSVCQWVELIIITTFPPPPQGCPFAADMLMNMRAGHYKTPYSVGLEQPSWSDRWQSDKPITANKRIYCKHMYLTQLYSIIQVTWRIQTLSITEGPRL